MLYLADGVYINWLDSYYTKDARRTALYIYTGKHRLITYLEFDIC